MDHQRYSFNAGIQQPLSNHRAMDLRQESERKSRAIDQHLKPLATGQLRTTTHNTGAIEVQAIALRMQGKTYTEIATALDCGTHLAKQLVEAGSRLLVDEDATVQLRLHQARLEGLVSSWYGLATGQTPRPLEPAMTLAGTVEQVPALGTDRKSAAVITIQLLALQQKLAPWADKLPTRGAKEAGEEAFYAEAHAILMRADERSGQWRPDALPPGESPPDAPPDAPPAP